MTFDEAMVPLFEYVDKLDDEERDRVVTGRDWRPGAYLYGDGARCLVGTVAGFTLADADVRFVGEGGPEKWVMLDNMVTNPRIRRAERHGCIHTHFDHACHEFGTERVVAALKARAGASLPPLASPAEPHALTDGRTHG